MTVVVEFWFSAGNASLTWKKKQRDRQYVNHSIQNIKDLMLWDFFKMPDSVGLFFSLFFLIHWFFLLLCFFYKVFKFLNFLILCSMFLKNNFYFGMFLFYSMKSLQHITIWLSQPGSKVIWGRTCLAHKCT